jgi:soluble lytic murein transglycosylase
MLLSLPLAAGADIYQYTDEQGVLHFTNVGGGKNQRKIAPEPKRITVSEPSSADDVRPRIPASSSSTFLSTYSDIINDACDKHGVDPALVHAIVKVESDFNAYAISRKGAMGLMQLMPQTAVELNVRNSFNPSDNIYGGVKYLRYLLDRYEGNLQLALAAYNSGETSVKKWGTIPPFRETQQYVRKILQIYNGNCKTPMPRYTIYVGYGNDGTLVLTDNPSSHPSKKFTRKLQNNL